MKELVGSCHDCGKDIYCRDGFLDGVHSDGKVRCFDCSENLKENEKENSARQ